MWRDGAITGIIHTHVIGPPSAGYCERGLTRGVALAPVVADAVKTLLCVLGLM